MSENLPQKKVAGPQRFIEKGPQVVFDTKTKLYWLKKDSWQDKGKFLNWHESRDYADKKNMRKIGGFHDWRLPTHDEAATLFDKSVSNNAKGGHPIHIDAIFPEGSFKDVWLDGDTSTRRPRFEFMEGTVKTADEYSFGATRLVRRDSVVRDHTRPPKRR